MDEKTFFNMVQGSIGYTFKNPDLIRQAFTRRSYTEENGGENNEVLEFIGDKALDFAVIKLLVAKFGSMKNGDPVDGTKFNAWEKEIRHQKGLDKCNGANEFVCAYDEGELTKIKSRMVQKKNLARRMDEMCFSKQLIMGKSDIKNGVYRELSVKEDLFEAIIGAVTIDCGWDFNVICSVVEAMLIPEEFLATDEDDNYVRLVLDWVEREHNIVPWVKFIEASYTSTWYMKQENTIYQHFPLEYNHSRLKYHCYLLLLDSLPEFCGFGASKSEARMNVCKLAYEWLCENDYIREPSIKDEIENPNKDDAINQLEILARRGYFTIPTYDFEQKHDKDGNPIWSCQCNIAEYDKQFKSKSSSKKDAKKTVAFKMLQYLLSEEDN